VDVDARAVFGPQAAALLRGVPFLSVLPEYDIERLAQSSRWRVVLAGAVVIRQCDPGRAFYVVAEGELAVDVDVDARRRPFTLGLAPASVRSRCCMPSLARQRSRHSPRDARSSWT